ncbi:MAG: class I SAM-dependent methyltransferase [Lachnospiraceae bacterium]|nr:class I SAM-dependent methyltransferase [Lachnospiraceae bacterium]
MSQQYSDFSNVYDLFMDNVPYEQWADSIVETLRKHGIEGGLVLDLGCGTGTLTRMLSDNGYDMIGVDSSEDMLMIAREKSADSQQKSELLNEDLTENEILYLCQDITDFELYGTVKAVVSTCDSLNYITEPDDLLQTFKLVNNYIEPDGIFIFDMNAPEKYEQVLKDNVFAENRDDASFIWENTFDEDSRINEYALTLFLEDEETGLYERIEEFHYQRAYSREEILDLLGKAGFEVLESREEDLRLYYTVKVMPGKKLGNIC